MMLAMVPPLFMAIMHPRLDALAADQKADEQPEPAPAA